MIQRRARKMSDENGKFSGEQVTSSEISQYVQRIVVVCLYGPNIIDTATLLTNSNLIYAIYYLYDTSEGSFIKLETRIRDSSLTVILCPKLHIISILFALDVFTVIFAWLLVCTVFLEHDNKVSRRFVAPN